MSVVDFSGKKVVLDLETTWTEKLDEAGDPYRDFGSPYSRDNYVVRLGIWDSSSGHYHEFDGVPDGLNLRNATVVGHNIKYDAQWLMAYGVDLTGVKWEDTMLREHLIHRGNRTSLGLSTVAPRYGGTKKNDVIKVMWDSGLNTDEIIPTLLSDYLKGDVMNTVAVYKGQKREKALQQQAQREKFGYFVLDALIGMEAAGCQWNAAAYEEVKEALYKERAEAERALIDEIKNILGNKFEEVFLGFKGTRKKKGGNVSYGKFIDSATELSKLVYGVKVKPECKEAWSAFATRWKPYHQGAATKLQTAIETMCESVGYGANLKYDPAWAQNAEVAKGEYLGKTGLKADGKTLLAALEHGKISQKARRLIGAIVRYSKTDTAITGNLAGFIKGLRDDGRIHGSFNIAGTTTGRLSSSAPNMQNLPREGTSPVKKLICSRFPEGKLVGADYKQLEFRVVGALSADTTLLTDVETDFDIHTHTAKQAFKETFAEADDKKRKALRTRAKTITFAFQYGAMPKNDEQQAIFDAFYGKYAGVASWQSMVAAGIMASGEYVCPFTGQRFYFADANYENRFSWSTKAKNYPVQYLGAMVTQAAMASVYRRIKGRDDIKLILQVHDSLVLDAAKDSVEEAKTILTEEMEGVSKVFLEFFGVEIKVPFPVDTSVGDTYYDL